MNQPELPIDPPAEIEVDPELTTMIEAANEHKHWLQASGIDLAEANLLTPSEDRSWELGFWRFERLLVNAASRVAQVSADRRKAEADAD